MKNVFLYCLICLILRFRGSISLCVSFLHHFALRVYFFDQIRFLKRWHSRKQRSETFSVTKVSHVHPEKVRKRSTGASYAVSADAAVSRRACCRSCSGHGRRENCRGHHRSTLTWRRWAPIHFVHVPGPAHDPTCSPSLSLSFSSSSSSLYSNLQVFS